MASNYPPGVSESDIPGNRPCDREIVIIITLTVGELRALKTWRSLTANELSSYEIPEPSVNDILTDLFNQITSTPID